MSNFINLLTESGAQLSCTLSPKTIIDHTATGNKVRHIVHVGWSIEDQTNNVRYIVELQYHNGDVCGFGGDYSEEFVGKVTDLDEKFVTDVLRFHLENINRYRKDCDIVLIYQNREPTKAEREIELKDPIDVDAVIEYVDIPQILKESKVIYNA